jgi:outer membrane protein assembly factor BamD (BamD/ComL family)
MPFICKHRLVLAPLFLLVCGSVWLLPLLPSQSQETGATPDAEETVAEQIRRLRRTENDPHAAIKLATQYLAANPALTMERQRVHFELAAAQLHAKDGDAALATFAKVVAQYEGLDLDLTSDEYRVDDAMFFVGVIQDGKGDRAAARKCLEAFIEQFPQSNWRPRAMLDVGSRCIARGETEHGLELLQALVSQYPDSESAPSAIHDITRWLLSPEASVNEQSRAENVAAAHANLELLATKYGDAAQTTEAWSRVLRYHNNRNEPDEANALARRMIGLYFDADPKVAGRGLSVAALALLDAPELAADDRALAKRALTRYVAKRPGASCLPWERYRLACLRAQDAAADPAALEEAYALARVLATQYAADKREAEALRWANQFWLSPEASVDEQSRAKNVEAAHANLELLATKYGDAIQTTEAWGLVLRYHNHRNESDEANALARRMIGLYFDADPEVAGNALLVAGLALLDAPELAADDRALAKRALTRYLAQHADSKQAPAAIRDINRWLLSPEAAAGEQSRAENVAAAHANLTLLTEKYGGAIQTTEAWRCTCCGSTTTATSSTRRRPSRGG